MFVEEYLKDVRAAGYSRAAWATYVRRVGALVRERVWNNPQATRSVLTVGTGMFVLHVLASVALSFSPGPGFAVAYLRASALATLTATLLCLAHLALVRTPEGVACSRLSAADWLTLLRATMAPGVLMFASTGQWSLALGWVVFGGLTDVVDGLLARAMGGTLLGRVLDPVVDILFNLCMIVGLHQGGLLPAWVLALVLVRYGLLVFGALYIYVARGPVRIQPTAFGKASGVLIYALVGTHLLIAAGGSAETTARVAQLLETAIGFLTAAAVVQVGVMGWYNVKLTGVKTAPPRVMADVEFKPPRRRDP
ncbi:MAG: CDP-alcohol phosphatidyltransferase family protein [Candidatus Eisenbacteria bacterium]|nr:CDP-alcohol phosphatidyltransferase family protein [Candidatus Eisenbacteria bacterium]